MSEKAADILNRLLERIERQPERVNRVIERLPERALLSQDRDALYSILQRAESLGAIKLDWGRYDVAHNIQRVVLADAAKLYDFLGREPSTAVSAAAVARIRACLADWRPTGLPDYAQTVLAELEAGWAKNRKPFLLEPGDVADAVGFLQSLVAVRENPGPGLDMRSFSRRQTGHSKTIETQISRLARHLKALDDLPGYLDDPHEILAAYGIEKYPQPILVAGPISVAGQEVRLKPYIGLAPEAAAQVTLATRPEYLLTIENLASFNRYVREARAPADLIIYSGGFPARRTLQFIRRLAGRSDKPAFHWGDIDAGGLRIAHHIHRNLPGGLRLHLMEPELARRHGAPADPIDLTGSFPPDSPVAGLAAFLASSDAHTLEQEELDPVRVAV